MPVPPSSAYPPGTALTVGSHDVVTEQFIGEGGFAHVYTVRVSPAIPGQEIACLKRVQVPNKTYLNLLRAEVEAMQRLKGSSNIVDYYDSHAERMKEPNAPGQYEVFLLMEYCSRGGLIDFMNTRLRDQLREHEILKIMYDITLGVAHMHYLSPPLLHRDLKIENVLIRGDGTYMLCDFGSASPVLRAPKNPAEFRILEDDIQHHTTVQYRAPEMIDLSLGQPIDEKSDIWALGIFLYKLCYYTTPFERPNQTLEQFQALILTASYTIPPRPAYSERLRNMIRILLQPDPRLRPNVFQVMQEVCAMRHVECPIQDIYSRPRPVTQPMVMPGLQMVPGPAGTPAGPAAGGTPAAVPSPSLMPIQTVQNPPVKTLQQPIQLPQQSVSAPTTKPLQLHSGSEPMSPESTGSPEPGLYETEDDLAARYPSVEDIDRTMSIGSAKVPRRKSSDMSATLSADSSMGSSPTTIPASRAGAPAPLAGRPPASGAAASGAGASGTATTPGRNVPLIDLDSPPAKPPRPSRDSLMLQSKPQQARPQVPPALPQKPPKPGHPLVKSAPATEYFMPQRPQRSRQTSPVAVAVSNDEDVTSSEDEAVEAEGAGPFQESRMTSEASKLKQILTGIGDRPSTVIMDKPEESRSMSSVDFLRTLGSEGPGQHHHPHLHVHSKSRKHSLFYNSAAAGTTRQLHADKEAEEDEEDDDEDEAYEYGGANVRVGSSQMANADAGGAYVSTDDEELDDLRDHGNDDDDEDNNEDDDENRFNFSDSAAASPLASPGKIVPAQAPSTDHRSAPKPTKPSVKPPAAKPTAKPSANLSTKPSTKPAPMAAPAVKPPGHGTSHALHAVVDLPGKPTKPVQFAHKPRPLSVLSHSTSELEAFQPSNSIQQRVRALLSGQERQHPPVRTAKGYGRFTDTFDGELQPAARSKSMGSEVREVRELREMAPAVPSRESKPKAHLSRSLSAQSLVKPK